MRGPDIHREVLDNLEDGVLVVGTGGRIETLNPAAERILGLEAGEAAGRSFAELFIQREGFDDFTQLIIDATAAGAGGERRVVRIEDGGEARSLSVATSRLRRPSADCSPETVAAIAVFSDITELRELRETELRLAQEAEAQHRRLEDAYREIEDRNEALAAALRKVRIVQSVGMVLAVGLFFGASLLSWQSLDPFGSSGPAAEASAGSARDVQQMTVRPRTVSRSISLKGVLSPWRKVTVLSPVNATVSAVRFQEGHEVSEGQSLLELDLSRARADLRRKRLKYTRALNKVQKLESWDRSAEMTAARRSFTKAELDLERSRTNINKSRFLLNQGLISAAEHEDAERRHRGQLLDMEAAKDEFASVRAQGNSEALEEARLEFEDAQHVLETARGELQAFDDGNVNGIVRAPIAGVVLSSERAGRGLTEGRLVSIGKALLTIGDFSRLSVVVKTDETDIAQLRPGQRVAVTGNAFRGLRLTGEVSRISSQADPKSRGIPKFDVAITLDPVGRRKAARLRAGMSAKVRIVTYSNPKALLVPIDAVGSSGSGYRLQVLDPATGEAEEREVEIGPTTRDSVEIRTGLKAGETILLPEG